MPDEDLGHEIDFHQADVYDAVEVLGAASYDLVFTGIGALCWIPDIARWAQTVAGLLKPRGRLFIREGHPMMWALEGSQHGDLLTLGDPYFETKEPMVYDDGGTYVETDVEFSHNLTHSWNHGLGEIATALFDAGMDLTSLTGHDSAPWENFPGKMTEDEQGEWRLTDHPERLAATYTLQAVKRR